MNDIFGHWNGRYSYADKLSESVIFALSLKPRLFGWLGRFRGPIQDQFNDGTVWNGHVYGNISGSTIRLSKIMEGRNRSIDPLSKETYLGSGRHPIIYYHGEISGLTASGHWKIPAGYGSSETFGFWQMSCVEQSKIKNDEYSPSPKSNNEQSVAVVSSTENITEQEFMNVFAYAAGRGEPLIRAKMQEYNCSREEAMRRAMADLRAEERHR